MEKRKIPFIVKGTYTKSYFLVFENNEFYRGEQTGVVLKSGIETCAYNVGMKVIHPFHNKEFFEYVDEEVVVKLGSK